MMQTLRKKTKYVLIIALIGFAGLIFFQWGANVSGTKVERKTDIVKIDGIPVSYTEYSRFIRQKEQEIKGISRDEIWNLMLEEIMWNNLIKREKIRVTDEEILAVIKHNPPREIYESEFMKGENGEFDFNKYYELLRTPQSRAWLLEYEYNLRRQLPKEKLRSLLSSFGWISPYEDSLIIAGQTNKYDVSYLMMPLFRARNLLEISEDETGKYFNNNRKEFINPELRILKFVFFERKPSPYDTLETRERIQDFNDRIEEGEDFLEVAKEVSDDTAVVKSFEGKLGLKPYLMNVYNELKNGEMSDIIQAPHGFEIIKRIRKGLIYKVKVDIEVSPTTIGEIYDEVMSFKETAQEIGFDSAGAEVDLQVRKTYPMNKDNVSFPVRNTEGLAAYLSKAKTGEIGGPFSSIGGYYLFSLDSIIPETHPVFEDIKVKIKHRMEKERAVEIIANWLDKVHDQLAVGKTMEAIVSEDTVIVFREMKDLTLMQIQTGLGHEFAGVVATLSTNQISQPLILDWAGYIIRCDRKEVNPFDSTMVTFLQMKRQARLIALTADIFTPKKIEDYRDEFFE
jgi:hypothetical protein